MNKDWKPTEQNIGQPVSDTYIQPQGTLHIYSKWYDVDATKITSIKDVEALFSAIGMKVSETNENFDKVKHLLVIPEKPKTLDEITQEFDEKIDELIENTKNKFHQSRYISEKLYNTKFDKIIENFEYARKNGNFPLKLKLTYGTGLSAYTSPYTETSFVIKQGNNHKGYYTIGNQRYLRYYMPDKPNAIVRFFMRTCLGFVWVDEKDT